MLKSYAKKLKPNSSFFGSFHQQVSQPIPHSINQCMHYLFLWIASLHSPISLSKQHSRIMLTDENKEITPRDAWSLNFEENAINEIGLLHWENCPSTKTMIISPV